MACSECLGRFAAVDSELRKLCSCQATTLAVIDSSQRSPSMRPPLVACSFLLIHKLRFAIERDRKRLWRWPGDSQKSHVAIIVPSTP